MYSVQTTELFESSTEVFLNKNLHAHNTSTQIIEFPLFYFFLPWEHVFAFLTVLIYFYNNYHCLTLPHS